MGVGKATGDGPSAVIPTGLGPSCSYPCVRSLSRRGVRTIVASEHEDAPAFASRYCDERLVLPPPREDLIAYKDALVATAARPDVRTVIPTREEDVYVLSRYEEEFAPHVGLVIPPMEALRTVHDRILLADAAEAAGVPVPETRRLGEVDDWDPEFVVKSRYNLLTDAYLDPFPSGTARQVKLVKHLAPGETPDVAAIREELGHEPIVQEFVPKADEYMFAALYDRGDPLATFQHRQVRGDSWVGGGGVYRRSVYDQELEDVARRLLDHLDWHGLACVEYVEDANTGEYKLIEINPRTWQSLPSTVYAGADFPYYYWLAATGRTGEIHPGYELDRGSHFLRGELGYFGSLFADDSPHIERPSVGATLREVVSSLRADPRFDYVRLDDPRLFVAGTRRLLWSRLS